MMGQIYSLWYGWYKGYKAHIYSTPKGVVLSYAFTTANVHDSKYIYEIAGTFDIFAVHPINPCNGEQKKSSHRRTLPHFAHTIFEK